MALGGMIGGGVSALAFRQRDEPSIHPVVPAVGTLGTFGFAPLMLFNLYSREPGTFWMVVALGVGAVVVELLYLERGEVEREPSEVEERLNSRL
jgi:hypothetical protein